VNSVWLKRGTVGGLVAATAVLSGCGSSNHNSAPPSSVPTTTVAAPAPTSPSSSTTTTTVPATPSTTSLIGLALGPSGTTLVPPDAPTAFPYTPNCRSLIDPGFYGSCVVVTAPSGTIAAISERQSDQQAGSSVTPTQERDLVYHRVGSAWHLALRRVTTSTGYAPTSDLWQSDIDRDGDPKAVFVTPAPNSQFGNELDVVEATGAVTLYRQLHGGFATIASGGGLETYVPATPTGYDEAVINYSAGAWRITSVTQVSQAQAQAESDQPFYDPQGVQASE